MPTATQPVNYNPNSGFVPRDPVTGNAVYTGSPNSTTSVSSPASGGAAPQTTVNYNPVGGIVLRDPVTGNAIYAPMQANGQTTPTPTGVMNANISTSPSANKPVVPSPVVTSAAAEKDLANKKAQLDQLQADTAAHQAAVATPTAVTTQTTDKKSSEPLTLDQQIEQALGNLQTGNAAIDANAQDQISPIQARQQELQTQFNNDATIALTRLNNIASGTYPLSQAENSLLASTAAMYNATIQAQQTANSAYVGQMSETLASLGIDTSAPTQSIGLMHAAISSGEGKIADLNAQMAKALSDLQIGFQQNDYKLVSDAWDKSAAYMGDRIKALQDMQTQVMEAAKQQKQDNKEYVTTSLQYIVKSAEFDAKQKQDAIENAFKQGQINETQRHNLRTESISQQNANRLSSSPTKTSGGGTNTPGLFTKSQINKGASNAAIDISKFSSLDDNDKNYFINSYANFAAAKKQVADGKATKQDLLDAIDAANISDNAKDILRSQAGGTDATESSSGSGGLWGWIKGVVGLE